MWLVARVFPRITLPTYPLPPYLIRLLHAYNLPSPHSHASCFYSHYGMVQNSHFLTSQQEFHIVVTTQNCNTSSKVRVHSPNYAPSIPLTNSHHSVLSYTILLAYPTFKPFSFMESIHIFRGQPTMRLPTHSPHTPF